MTDTIDQDDAQPQKAHIEMATRNTASVSYLDPAGPRIVDPHESDFERSAQRTMAHAMAKHAQKPGRSLMRAGVIAQLVGAADWRDGKW